MLQQHVGKRLARVALYALMIQCLLVIIVLGMVWQGIGVGARLASAITDSEFLPPRTGSLRSSVRNIFGDPVPGARVRIADRAGLASDDGSILLTEIPIGLHELKISAEGYQELSLRLRITEGETSPLIKYDQGLWPQGFAVDFHAFYASEVRSEQRVFLQVGLANGSDQPVYIRDFHTLDRNKDVVAPMLTSPEGYRRLALMNTGFTLATAPYALVLKPRGTVHIELPPLVVVPLEDDVFTLVIRYGDQEAHRKGNYQTMELTAAVQWEADLSPHRP